MRASYGPGQRPWDLVVIDEAQRIKTSSSALASAVKALKRDRSWALTGTPLINQIEDFRMIWQFLGWIDEKKPLPRLMEALEETELTPVDPGFFSAARRAVVGTTALVSVTQHIGAIHLVVQRVESIARRLLRFGVQRLL